MDPWHRDRSDPSPPTGRLGASAPSYGGESDHPIRAKLRDRITQLDERVKALEIDKLATLEARRIVAELEAELEDM